MNTDHLFYHDKEYDLRQWRESQPLPQVMKGLTLVDTLMQWDSEEKAIRWETIRWELMSSECDMTADIDLFAEGRYEPGNKDKAWVQDVTFGLTGLVVMIRYLDDYTFRVPYWCTYFIQLK